MNRLKNQLRGFIAILLCGFILAGCSVWDLPHFAHTDGTAVVSGGESAPFEIRMLDVGQGLSILIVSDGHYLLYDGGGRDYSSYVVSYLRRNEIDKLDYMFVSHYDEDHISGLVGVLNTTTVDLVISPDYETDSKIYMSFLSALEKNGAETGHPSVGDVYSLGNATIQVLSPKTYAYRVENNNSIAVRVTYGAFSCLITGDAESEAEADMLASGLPIDSDLYVVGHHGSSSSSGKAFVGAVSPSYAFISAGKGNSYGHPTDKTLDTLADNGIRIFRSDIQGEVTAYSDGRACWFSAEPCDDMTAGTVQEDEPAAIAGGYVLNINTKKFHNPDCDSVSHMSEKNKQYTEENREELISRGYSPCGSCKP